jgi:hypothetical protein
VVAVFFLCGNAEVIQNKKKYRKKKKIVLESTKETFPNWDRFGAITFPKQFFTLFSPDGLGNNGGKLKQR